MNCGKHVTVTCDLLFTAIFWPGFLLDDHLQAFVRCADALDLVGRVGALDFGNLDELCQHVGVFVGNLQLLALILVNRRK